VRPASDRLEYGNLTVMRYLPIFIDLKDAPALVVGGGRVALRKLELLQSAGAVVTLVAPAARAAIEAAVARSQVIWWRKRFESGDVNGMRVVFAATDSAGINAEVARAARDAGILVNVADDAERSTFILPAIVDRSPLVVAISSGGVAPMLATAVRARLEAFLDHSWSRLAEFAERWRKAIRSRRRRLPGRRMFYEWLLDGPAALAVRAGREAEADRLVEQALEDRPEDASRGLVSLVGAGPGDPGLLTLRALNALQRADVIVADRLIGPEILALARREAEVIDVGKAAGGHGAIQDEINRLLVHHARGGRRVVRLKGGDPLIFGRGGEEAEWLARQHIAFEIVPGITAALGCAAYAGIPLTHRRHAHSLQFVTAHGAETMDHVDWRALARPGQTLVVYMGVAIAGKVQDRLLAARQPPSTPAAIIENGTLADQRVIVTDLGSLARSVTLHDIRSPALLVIGEVAALATRLSWFGMPPLPDALLRKTA
jgi:uroporphyrin-III C-methyltransferase/precorrin-2 dehydrogenase/sirohydrochlorin ferrochelatase